MGLAGTLFPGVLWAQAQAQAAKKITKEMIENAAAIADVPISEGYKEMMLENLNDHANGYEEITTTPTATKKSTSCTFPILLIRR